MTFLSHLLKKDQKQRSKHLSSACLLNKVYVLQIEYKTWLNPQIYLRKIDQCNCSKWIAFGQWENIKTYNNDF